MLRIGLVGIDSYGAQVTKIIREVEQSGRCRLVAAADMRLGQLLEPATALAATGVKLFDDAGKMFQAMRGQCDAMYIVTSIHTHAPLTIAAMELGYHVMLEKPPAATVQEVDRMLETARQTERICGLGFQLCYEDGAMWIEQQIAAGRLGKIRSIRCYAGWPRGYDYYNRNPWAGKLKRGDAWVLDGPATNALAHQINNMIMLASGRRGQFATPTSVRAELYAANAIEGHDTASIEIKTAEGPTIYFAASHCPEKQFNPVVLISSEKCEINWQVEKLLTARFEDQDDEIMQIKGSHRVRMLGAFIDAVERRDPAILRCGLAQSRGFVAALDGAHESTRTIHRIPPQYVREMPDLGGGRRLVVEGVDEAVMQSATQGCLLSDLKPAVPWAKATSPFDLTGYTQFPRQFDATQA